MLLHVSAVHFSLLQVGILAQKIKRAKGEKPLLTNSGYIIFGKFIIIPEIK